MVFTRMSKGTFPGQSEGAGSINIIRIIAIKLGDFDGVARAWRAHSLTQQHPGECAPTHSLLYNRDSYRGEGEQRVWVVIYLDDLLVTSALLTAVQRVKQQLLSKFSGKDLGEVGMFVGVCVHRNRELRTIHISQPEHA